METLELGGLTVRRFVVPGETAGKSPLTVILMHGFGAAGDDLAGLAAELGAPPGTTLLFPEAPHRLSDFVRMPGAFNARAWWMIDMEGMQRAIAAGEERDLSRQIPEGLAPARVKVNAMLDAIVASGTPSDRIVLGGFSQGSMLALDVALRSDRPLAGLVLLSSTIIAEEEWKPLWSTRAGLPVFQSHGTGDAILPHAVAERQRGELEGGGMVVTFSSFEGGHGIGPSVVRDLRGWLAARV